MLALLCIEALLLIYFTYVSYDTSVRIYIYNSIQVLIVLMTLATIFKISKKAPIEKNPELLIITVLFLIAHSARIIGTPFYPAPQNFLASGNFQTLLAFGLMIIHISYSQVFANMHASVLNDKISKALLNAQTKERQKVEVLGYIGHDLRAPLATISSYAALLLARADEDQHHQLQTIQRSIKYQLGLIDELLEYTKSELQPLAVRPKSTDLHALVQDIADYAVALSSQKNNRFELRSPDLLPLLVLVDGKRLQQVLLNLLSNAAKFTSDGFIELYITCTRQGQQCDLQFTVSDSGIGIDLSDGVDIFGAFQQVQAQSGSTGLGLFIAQHVVSAMGGSLSAHSALGKGSSFSFQLTLPQIGAGMSLLHAPTASEQEALWAAIAPHLLEILALQQLEDFATRGQWSDIQSWIDEHTNDTELIGLQDYLLESLDRFDFSSIAALARKLKTG